jgi:hypothetical protein
VVIFEIERKRETGHYRPIRLPAVRSTARVWHREVSRPTSVRRADGPLVVVESRRGLISSGLKRQPHVNIFSRARDRRDRLASVHVQLQMTTPSVRPFVENKCRHR